MFDPIRTMSGCYFADTGSEIGGGIIFFRMGAALPITSLALAAEQTHAIHTHDGMAFIRNLTHTDHVPIATSTYLSGDQQSNSKHPQQQLFHNQTALHTAHWYALTISRC